MWKREQCQRRYRNHTHRLNEKELKEEFDEKCEDEKRVYKSLADDFIKQGSSLHHSIIKALMNTRENFPIGKSPIILGDLLRKIQ